MSARSERFPLFDALRAGAALAVLGFHASFAAGALAAPSLLRPYLIHLDAGVSVFFLISGFLLYRPFVRARLAGDQAPLTGAYAWRRFLRIVPAYWVALTVITVWVGTRGVFTASGIPLFYGFAQIYDKTRGTSGIGQAWTLCVEVTFYAFLPLWALAMERLLGRSARREYVALALLWLASLAYKIFAVHHISPSSLESGPWLMPLPNFLDQFAIGMALAVVSLHAAPRSRPLEVIRRRPWLCWLGAAVAYWAVSTQIGLNGNPLQPASPRVFLARHELYTLVALGLLLPVAFGSDRRDPLRRALAWRPLAYVGLVSYGVYLWHDAILGKFAPAVNGWVLHTLGLGATARLIFYFVVVSLLSIAVATVSWFLVERPALSLRRLVRAGPLDTAEAIPEAAPAAAPSVR